jgi:hypothetical protein
MQRVYIDLDLDPLYGRAAISGLAFAHLKCILGNPVDVEVVFHRSGTLARLATSHIGVFTVKLPNARDDDPLFSDVTMTELAITTPAAGYAYKFEGVLDTTEIITAAGPAQDSVDLRCSVSWTVPGQSELRCEDLTFTLLNSSRRPSDTLPAKAGQSQITNDYIRILCPDGQWRRATLFNEE